jgi:anti-anti-sigma factor
VTESRSLPEPGQIASRPLTLCASADSLTSDSLALLPSAGAVWRELAVPKRSALLSLMELVRLEKEEGSPSFRLIGELDASNVDDVRAELVAELRRANRLTLDTSELAFMDSQGLHMLIDLGREAANRGAQVTLINCSRQVRRLLDVAVPSGIPGVDIEEADK